MESTMTDKSGIAVMASLTDYGLTGKEARGVYAEEKALPKPLAAAADSIRRFAQRMGFTLEGSSKDMAACIAESYRLGKAPDQHSHHPVPGVPQLEI